jgi:L-rhamnose mutarotase
MPRVAWTARLKPDMIDGYVEEHARVWPEVIEAIRNAGIHDYSIWLWEDRVFAQYETDDPEASRRIEEDAEATKRWRARMRDYFADEVATEGVTWLPEIFRLD